MLNHNVEGKRDGQIRTLPERRGWPLRWPLLLVSVFAAGVQAVEVQEHVEHQGVGVFGFAAVDRVNGKEDDVACEPLGTSSTAGC